MKKKEKERIAKELKNYLEQSEKMWKERESNGGNFPFIIGYLQGAIRGVIHHLEN